MSLSGIWGAEFLKKQDERLAFEIGNTLQLSTLDEWYRVSRKNLEQAGASGFVKKRGGLIKLLKSVYPNHDWKAEKFSSRQKKSSQWWLCKVLSEIFPPYTVILEEVQLPFIHPGHLITFDIYIPSLNLIIEYHGSQHYHDHYMFGNVISRHERDEQRRVLCNYLNITYLEVPYWWEHDKESVLAIIHYVRPDIVPHTLATPFHYARLGSSKDVSVKKVES